jgi:hypothetical protein
MCGDLPATQGTSDRQARARQWGQESRGPEPLGSGGTPVDPAGQGYGDLPAPLGGTRDVTLSLLGHHARECRLTEVAHRVLLVVLHAGLLVRGALLVTLWRRIDKRRCQAPSCTSMDVDARDPR